MKILDKLLQKQENAVEKKYRKKLLAEREKVRSLTQEINSVSTSAYPSGNPDNAYNRGDESDAFSFPVKWANTCKRMEKSCYLSPILEFYRAIFKTFSYEITLDGESKDKEKILSFLNSQFKRAGSLKEFAVNVSHGMLVYGFYYFAPKIEVVSAKKHGLNGMFEGIYDFKYFDPASLQGFVFDENDKDIIKSISIFSQPKRTSGTSAHGLRKENSGILELDIESSLIGYASYGGVCGNPMGRPFLYDVYTLWKIMESMDNSFNKNLQNIGEHSFNFVSSKSELDDTEMRAVYKDVKKFIEGRGGVFVSRHGRLEKIDGIDGKKWNDIRDGIIATIFKSKGADIKALGMTRGATRDLASFAQSDSVIIAKDIMESCLRQINKTMLKSYFKLNFSEYVNAGIFEYPEITVNLK